MNGRILVDRFLHAFESGDGRSLRETLSGDFVFAHEASPPAYHRHGYLLLAGRLNEAFPDWRFQHHVTEEDDGRVSGSLQIVGTHTGRLDLSMFGLTPLKPTDVRIRMPVEHGTWSYDDDGITSFKVEATPGGGMYGLLAQLGVSVPARPLSIAS